MEFHERLKELRIERGLTQKKLGSILNYGSSAIANYESGRNQPSIPDLKKIAHYFQVSLDYLLGDSYIANPNKQPLTNDEIAFMSRMLATYFFKQQDDLVPYFRFMARKIIEKCLILEKKYNKILQGKEKRSRPRGF